MRRLALALASSFILIASCSGAPRPVAADDLERVLLSPAEIENAMNANGITVNETATTMNDDSANIPDRDCRFIDAPAQAPVYDGSGWVGMRSQHLREPGDDVEHEIWQAVVSFPSAGDATRFFTGSVQRWPACSNRQYHYLDPDQSDTVFTAGPTVKMNDTLSTTRQGGAGAVCQRALTVRNNVAIDVAACPNNPGNTAVKIADQIAAKVSKM